MKKQSDYLLPLFKSKAALSLLETINHSLIKPYTDEEKKNFSIDDEFEDFVDGEYMNVAEAFCACDETGFMTFGDDGDGGCYFIYPPKYPWQCKENEPKSIDEVHKIIKDAVHKLCDISDEELEYLIDNDIYEYGCG